MANYEPPDWAQQPDEKTVTCYANAGTRYDDKHCPRCLLCSSQNAHRGQPCPNMTGRNNASLGKKWLDIKWPEHVISRTEDEVRRPAKRRREQSPEQRISIADQPDIDPAKNPSGHMLQEIMREKKKAKSAASAKTSSGDTVMIYANSDAQLRQANAETAALTKENEGLKSQVAALTQRQARVDELVAQLLAVCSSTNPQAPAGTPTAPMQPEAPGVQEDTVRRSLRRR
ncbi:hypothetical protein EJ07DRAFT_157055 [Lizonia empirigonia]|nr:hypothetical protein EJ07DRAFT_157055 [Lizonia empirigonia]